MKIIVRAFVLALTVTGSAAYTRIDATASKAVIAKPSSMPQPNCAPNDPDRCGWPK